jgi:hypothetical protein
MPSIPAVPYTIKTADTALALAAEGWTLQPHLLVVNFTEGAAPTLPSAQIMWRFGKMNRTAFTGEDRVRDPASAYVEPFDLGGKYVLIECPSLSIVWVGYVLSDAKVRWRQQEIPEGEDNAGQQRVSGGDQGFDVVDLTWFLGRTQISGTSSREADKKLRPIGYNCGAGDGRDLDVGRRRNRKPPTDAGFDPYDPLEFDFSDDAIEWSADAIVKHLLAEYPPRNQADEPSPVTFHLHDASLPYLNWFKPVVKIEGRTTLEILDEVISQKRGLTWKPGLVDVEGVLWVRIVVSSIAVDAVTMPNPDELDPAPALPAAATQAAFDPDAHELDMPPQVMRDGTRSWNRFRARGARSTSTLSALGSAVDEPTIPIHSSYTARWSDEDETDYNAGVSVIDPDYATYDDAEKGNRNDLLRKMPRLERVYRYFTLTLESESGEELQPILEQATGSVIGDIALEPAAARIQRATLLKAGYTYNDATAPVRNGDFDTAESRDELLPPLLLFNVAGATTLDTDEGANPDGGWRRGESFASHAEKVPGDDGKQHTANFGMRPLAAAGGFEILVHGNGGMPHSLTAAGPAEPSAYPGIVSYNRMGLTVTIEWDCYCEAVWPVAVPTNEPVQEMLIQLGERVRFDWLVKGTIYDLDSHGQLRQVATAGALNDYRWYCETVAKLAHQWYSAARAKVTIAFKTTSRPFDVGDLITEIGTAEAAETVNAVVSQMTHDFENGGTVATLGYAELDFSKLT